jgi:hypothetical protein
MSSPLTGADIYFAVSSLPACVIRSVGRHTKLHPNRFEPSTNREGIETAERLESGFLRLFDSKRTAQVQPIKRV